MVLRRAACQEVVRVTACGGSPFAIGLVATQDLAPTVRCLTNAVGAGWAVNLTRLGQFRRIGCAARLWFWEPPSVECSCRLVQSATRPLLNSLTRSGLNFGEAQTLCSGELPEHMLLCRSRLARVTNAHAQARILVGTELFGD